MVERIWSSECCQLELVLFPRTMIAEKHARNINPIITAYSTAVGPSSVFRNLATIPVIVFMVIPAFGDSLHIQYYAIVDKVQLRGAYPLGPYFRLVDTIGIIIPSDPISQFRTFDIFYSWNVLYAFLFITELLYL
jgi:hypothetical protein